MQSLKTYTVNQVVNSGGTTVPTGSKIEVLRCRVNTEDESTSFTICTTTSGNSYYNSDLETGTDGKKEVLVYGLDEADRNDGADNLAETYLKPQLEVTYPGNIS